MTINEVSNDPSHFCLRKCGRTGNLGRGNISIFWDKNQQKSIRKVTWRQANYKMSVWATVQTQFLFNHYCLPLPPGGELWLKTNKFRSHFCKCFVVVIFPSTIENIAIRLSQTGFVSEDPLKRRDLCKLFPCVATQYKWHRYILRGN